MTQQGKRAYHGRRGRRGPAPIVWLIALAVVIATVVLVVAGLSKKPAPDPIPLPGTVTDNGSAKPDEPDTPHTPDESDKPQTPENDPPQQTESDEPYIDASGLLQYSTKGHYVQADSYQGGGEAPWNLLLVNDWNPLPAGYDNDVSFTTVSGGKQVDSRIIDAVNQMLNDASAYDLAVVSAYRPQSEQETLYWRKVKQYTDKGYSDLTPRRWAARWSSVPASASITAALPWTWAAAATIRWSRALPTRRPIAG